MDDSGRKTAKRTRAIVALLEEPTVRAAAGRAGIGETTLRRWLRQDQDFKAAYREARSEVFGQAVNQLRLGVLEAISALREIVVNSASTDRARVSAARALLDGLIHGVQIEILDERLTDLEQRLGTTSAKEE